MYYRADRQPAQRPKQTARKSAPYFPNSSTFASEPDSDEEDGSSNDDRDASQDEHDLRPAKRSRYAERQPAQRPKQTARKSAPFFPNSFDFYSESKSDGEDESSKDNPNEYSSSSSEDEHDSRPAKRSRYVRPDTSAPADERKSEDIIDDLRSQIAELHEFVDSSGLALSKLESNLRSLTAS